MGPFVCQVVSTLFPSLEINVLYIILYIYNLEIFFTLLHCRNCILVAGSDIILCTYSKYCREAVDQVFIYLKTHEVWS